ncbi:MAG: hypothetical protein G3I10_05385 [Ferrovum sp.]|nr:hypothetical protein [Ferrovum sp.]
MKKQLFALLISLPILAHAEAPICQHYEISELQAMTPDQLQQLAANFTVTHYSTDPSQNWNNTDDINCTNELARVNDILQTKLNEMIAPIKAEAEDKTKQAEKAAYETTPEGILFKKAQDTCETIRGPGDDYANAGLADLENKPNGGTGRLGCQIFIQYSLAGENCNPNSTNTPEDIQCMRIVLSDVQVFAKKAQECVDNPPKSNDEQGWNGLWVKQDLSADADNCQQDVQQTYIAVMEQKRAHWKALGYYPDN